MFIYQCLLPHVIIKMFFPGEGFRAVGASMRRFPGVLPDVIRQVLFASEGFSTERALVRRFACVLSDVVHWNG